MPQPLVRRTRVLAAALGANGCGGGGGSGAAAAEHGRLNDEVMLASPATAAAPRARMVGSKPDCILKGGQVADPQQQVGSGGVSVPQPLLLVVDDVGWRSGTDSSSAGGPWRAGVDRIHTEADYLAIATLGQRLHMRVECGMILCDWDRSGVCARHPTTTWLGSGWVNAELDADGSCEWAENAASIMFDQRTHPGCYPPNLVTFSNDRYELTWEALHWLCRCCSHGIRVARRRTRAMGLANRRPLARGVVWRCQPERVIFCQSALACQRSPLTR